MTRATAGPPPIGVPLRIVTRTAVTTAAAAAALLVAAPAALAHECVNINKKPDAGVQVVIDATTDDVVWLSQGVQKRLENGVIEFGPGGGFHGLIGFDMTGDGVADVSTYIVGPESEIPLVAQTAGAECNGIVNIADYFACVSA